MLSFPDLRSQEFVSVSFSPDSKYVIAQGGSPDWTLVYWGWEKAKLMATIKTTNQQDSPIHQVRVLVCSRLYVQMYIYVHMHACICTYMYIYVWWLRRCVLRAIFVFSI